VDKNHWTLYVFIILDNINDKNKHKNLFINRLTIKNNNECIKNIINNPNKDIIGII